MKMKKRIQGSLCLLLGTVIWGSAFIAQSEGMNHIGPFTFQTIRCALAVVFLLVTSLLFDLKKFGVSGILAQWKNPAL